MAGRKSTASRAGARSQNRARSAATRKRATNNTAFLTATIPPSDTTRRWGSREQTAAECVMRAMQWVEICAQRIARDCSNQPVRLYVPARGGGKRRSWTRPVRGKAHNAYLRDPINGPGRKAAMWAEYADEVEEVTDHPILDLLNMPNPWTNGTAFFHLTYYSRLIAGNRYWYVVNGPGVIDSLYLMMPQWTRIVPSQTAFVDGYVYGRNGAIEEFFAADEVLHAMHLPSLRSPYYGSGPLHAVFGEADVDSAILTDQLAMWKNGARPDFMVSIPPESSDTAAAELQARINAGHRGPDKRGRFLVTTAASVTPLTFPPKDLESIKSLENLERRIWAAFGIPESELRVNSSNVSSANTGSAQYMRQTIKPLIDAEAEHWTSTLLPAFGIEPGEMWLCHDNPVGKDRELEARIHGIYLGSGVLTKDEVRQELGFDPLPDGMGEAQPPVDEEVPDDEGKPDEQGDDEDAENEEDKAKAGHRHRIVRKDDRGVQEAQFQQALLKWLNGIADRLTLNPDGTPNLEPFAAEFHAFVAPYAGRIFESGMAAQAASEGVAFTPERAMTAVVQNNLRLAGVVSQTVLDDVKQSVASAMAEGVPMPEVADKVRAALKEGNQLRAERIAVTETSRGYNYGTLGTLKDVGYTKKKWFLSVDPCPVCKAIAAKYENGLDIDTPFLRKGESLTLEDGTAWSTNYSDVDVPPVHPYCQCSLEGVE